MWRPVTSSAMTNKKEVNSEMVRFFLNKNFIWGHPMKKWWHFQVKWMNKFDIYMFPKVHPFYRGSSNWPVQIFPKRSSLPKESNDEMELFRSDRDGGLESYFPVLVCGIWWVPHVPWKGRCFLFVLEIGHELEISSQPCLVENYW